MKQGKGERRAGVSQTGAEAQLSLFADELSGPAGQGREPMMQTEAEGGMGAGGEMSAGLAQPPLPVRAGLPQGAEAMLGLLAEWEAQGWLRRIDLELARFLHQQAPVGGAMRSAGGGHDDDAGADSSLARVLLAAALCSWQLGSGHACLDLAAVMAEPERALSMPGEVCQRIRCLDLKAWRQACAAWPSLVAAGAHGDEQCVTPLVLQDARLYLRRYWLYERQVQAAIMTRLRQPAMADDAGTIAALRDGLGLLFASEAAGDGGGGASPVGAAGAVCDGEPAARPAASTAGPVVQPDWQKIACALAAHRRFGLITGGPGTGKTTTVVRLLALLQMLAQQLQGRFLQIGLAAPTGKAAARLNSSISGAIARLPLDRLPAGDGIRQAIPSTVQTLHRLLGSRPGTRHFRHDARHPLPLDVLVIDEASMVDLDMMAMVVQALPAEARLVLLGDKDQLASVEAGAILGELCARAHQGHYWPATAEWVAQVAGEPIAAALQDADGRLLDQGIVMLRHSHRFRADSGIGRLAERVNQGDVTAVRALWQELAADADIRRLIVEDAARHDLRQLVSHGWQADGSGAARGYGHYLRSMHDSRPDAGADEAAFDDWAAGVLAAHGSFQLLAALRQGPWGVEQLNRQIAQWLQQAGLIPASEGWYEGRPVMVTHNDYELQLMNGDVGIALMRPGLGLRVAFAGEPGAAPIRWVLPSRLLAVETVFAMTVHKAQGSEFDHAALAMPAELSPVLTRELVYTAITRARRFFTLCGPAGLEALFEATIRRQVLRASGLVAGMEAIGRSEEDIR